VNAVSAARIWIGLAITARTLLLLPSFFPGVFGRLMMANDTAGAGAQNTVMTGKVPGYSANRSALEATSRSNGRRAPTHGYQYCESRP
jgi:hypothetical protein